MLDEQEIIYSIALSRLTGVKLIEKRLVLERMKSAFAAFEMLRENLFSGLDFGKNFDSNLIEQAKKEYDFIVRNRVNVYRVDQKEYPFYLKQIPDAPLLLMTRGNVDALGNKSMLSVVGSRKMSSYGREFLKDFIRDLAPYGPTIVSGLAYGVDIHSHRLALEYSLPTIAVLGHGMQTIYPKIHRVESEIIQEEGLLLTEFQSYNWPLPVNFPRRNRIIAGLSRATVVVEAAAKGGALITASFAFDYNREVFALPGRQNDPLSEGCNNLIRQNKSSLLTSAKDIIDFFQWEKVTAKKPLRKMDDLSDFQIEIVTQISKGIVKPEELARLFEVKIQEIQVELFNLEMLGFIKNQGLGNIVLL